MNTEKVWNEFFVPTLIIKGGGVWVLGKRISLHVLHVTGRHLLEVNFLGHVSHWTLPRITALIKAKGE